MSAQSLTDGFRVGDLVMVLKGCLPYFRAGQVAKLVKLEGVDPEYYEDGGWWMDFEGQGNSRVYGDGVWFSSIEWPPRFVPLLGVHPTGKASAGGGVDGSIRACDARGDGSSPSRLKWTSLRCRVLNEGETLLIESPSGRFGIPMPGNRELCGLLYDLIESTVRAQGEAGSPPPEPVPVWTSEKPTQPGYYWWHDGVNTPEIVNVFDAGPILNFRVNFSWGSVSLRKIGGQWSGPLKEPSA